MMDKCKYPDGEGGLTVGQHTLSKDGYCVVCGEFRESNTGPRIIKLKWYCGYYVGTPKWHGTERYEPDECGSEFYSECLEDDYEEGMAGATCPKCGAQLTQSDDSPNVVSDEVYVNSL